MAHLPVVPACGGWQFDYSCDWTDEEYNDLDPALLARAEGLAVDALRALTLGAVGNCPVILRPCVASCTQEVGWSISDGFWSVPFMDRGRWYNGCGCKTDCACTSLSEVILPEPGRVTQVSIGTEVLDPSTYRVDNYTRLVRLDGEKWPSCQDMASAPGQEGSFAVHFAKGHRPGPSAFLAAGRLAAQFYKACAGDDGCSLPTSVVAMTRQGVSFEMSVGVFPNNVTGVQEVDAFLRVWNPYKATAPTFIYSPDAPAPRQTTWGM